MEAFDRLVPSGKVRYLGTSNDTTYGTTKALMKNEQHGFARFESIQNNFSLLNRRFLDELKIVCQKEKISLLPYSLLAGGVLSGKYNQDTNAQGRFSDYLKSPNKRQQLMASRFINDKTLATAWSKQFDFVASTIIGVTSAEQLDPIFDAMDFLLSAEILTVCIRRHFIQWDRVSPH